MKPKAGNSDRLPKQNALHSKDNKAANGDYALFRIQNAGRLFGSSVVSRAISLKSESGELDEKACQDGVQIESLDIPAGQMIAILGESGSGKSTLLNLLGNLLKGHRVKKNGVRASIRYQTLKKPRWGSGPAKIRFQELVPSNIFVRFWNELREYVPWPSSSLIRKEAGYVFQEAYLLKNATVSANLALPLRLRGMWSWFINEQRIERIARHLDQDGDEAAILSKLSKRSWQLSGGQAQRVAVGRAIVRNPSIILADEPTASLDPELGVRIMAMLRKWQKAGTPDAPRTVIWATHTMEHAASFADKIIILKKGKLVDLPDFQKFREKYGHSWPIDNPRDHVLIKDLLRGNISVLDKDMQEQPPTAIQEHVDDHLSRDQQIVDEAPDLSALEEKPSGGEKVQKTPWRSIGVLWRVALSDIFDHMNVDKGVGSRFLRRLVSIADGKHTKDNNQAFPFWKEFLSASFFTIFGLILIAVGFVSESGGMASLGHGTKDIVQGVVDYASFASEAAAQYCVSCAEYLPDNKSYIPWAGRASIVFGILLLTYLVLRSYVRSIGSKWEFLTYFLILLFLGGAIKSSDVIDDVFKARFKSPELGNTVIEARFLQRKLNDGNLKQLDKTLMALGFKPPAMVMVGGDRGEAKQFAFGRYQNVDVTIGRMPKNWKPVNDEQALEWGSLEAEQDKAQPKKKECSTSLGEKEGELLAIDMREPMVASLGFLKGKRLADLSRVPYEGAERKNNKGMWGVYLTRKMLRKLGFQSDNSSDNKNLADIHFCMDLYGEKIVRLAGIIDRLPNDTTSDYNILIDKNFYRSAYRDKKDKKLANFDKVTLYIDPEQPAQFIHAVECASSAGNGDISGCSRDLTERIKENLEYAFRVEGGFDKIKQAINMGDFFKNVSAGILVAFLLLAALLTLKISTSYILQNERSLCVMRAFGASVWQVLYLILLQFAIILLPGLLMVGVLAFYIWPTIGEPIALVLNVDSSSIVFSYEDAVNILSVVGGTLLLGCILAVFGWWAGSRWIAERLKQVG